MPPTAYRWVDEMDEIAKTSHTEGGFERHVFNRMSEVSRVVAHETDQGNEKTEDRRVGKTPGDVTKLMRQGLGEEQGESRIDRLKPPAIERSMHQPMSEILIVNITQSSNDSWARLSLARSISVSVPRSSSWIMFLRGSRIHIDQPRIVAV